MPLKITLTDMQDRKVYRGTLDQVIEQGKQLSILLTDASYLGYQYRIGQVRGWVSDLGGSNIYIIDSYGKRFRLRVLSEVVG